MAVKGLITIKLYITNVLCKYINYLVHDKGITKFTSHFMKEKTLSRKFIKQIKAEYISGKICNFDL